MDSAEENPEQLRLYSVDHPELYITNEASTCTFTRHLLKGLPHALLLEKNDKSLYIMLPACAKPDHDTAKGPAGFTASDLQLRRGNPDWIANIADVRHYLYPIHPSRMFFFTETLASALYMLIVRFVNRQYEQVFRLADFCVKDIELSPEEQQIFNQLKTLDDDLHPDAAACRLKIVMVTAGTKMGEHCPFDPYKELLT